ncbi:hypothetical protein ACFSUS_01210 [Spirosoma soli]|uniref:FUSC family protein n=1 Tax=Spirosoma soli TaxID=1770529 RepID=A0ABW5LX47_9BACT
MVATKDYSKLTQDELVAEDKKMKSGATAIAFVIGMLIGVAVWTATSGKFIFTVGLLAVALFIGYRHEQNKKALKAAISRKEAHQ